MKVFILFALIAVAVAESAYNAESEPAPVEEVVESEPAEVEAVTEYESVPVEVEYVPQPYSFGYDVKDSESYNDFEHSEKVEDHVTTGSYRVALPDGRTQIVTYRADKNGYTADVRYEGIAKYPEYVEKEYKPYSVPAYYPKY